MTSMNNLLKNGLADSIQTFHLPAYGQLPDTGLYLEQTARYINGCLAPLGCIEITGSMNRHFPWRISAGFFPGRSEYIPMKPPTTISAWNWRTFCFSSSG